MSEKAQLDIKEQIARIERMQKETRKFVAEQHKLIEEGSKLQSEQRKLMAEVVKLTWDGWLAPWLVVASLSGGAVVAVVNHLWR